MVLGFPCNHSEGLTDSVWLLVLEVKASVAFFLGAKIAPSSQTWEWLWKRWFPRALLFRNHSGEDPASRLSLWWGNPLQPLLRMGPTHCNWKSMSYIYSYIVVYIYIYIVYIVYVRTSDCLWLLPRAYRSNLWWPLSGSSSKPVSPEHQHCNRTHRDLKLLEKSWEHKLPWYCACPPVPPGKQGWKPNSPWTELTESIWIIIVLSVRSDCSNCSDLSACPCQRGRSPQGNLPRTGGKALKVCFRTCNVSQSSVHLPQTLQTGAAFFVQLPKDPLWDPSTFPKYESIHGKRSSSSWPTLSSGFL